jgi:hypothetical protein
VSDVIGMKYRMKPGMSTTAQRHAVPRLVPSGATELSAPEIVLMPPCSGGPLLGIQLMLRLIVYGTGKIVER